jgi:hypothetical protein
MSDEFSFGEPAKRPARLGAAKPETDRARARAGSSFAPKLVWIVAGLLVAGALAFVFLRGADEAGKSIADSQTNAVSQIDRAHDAAAQGTMGRAVVVALSLYAENGSFATDLATLSAYDPSLGFTSRPSTDPTTISYFSDPSSFGAAVRSESGTCWWAKVDSAGVTTYGSGKPCTGRAAMAASAASW